MAEPRPGPEQQHDQKPQQSEQDQAVRDTAAPGASERVDLLGRRASRRTVIVAATGPDLQSGSAEELGIRLDTGRS